jgi:hypothetical protein
MFSLCNSMISCCGFCPWLGLQGPYATQVRAPNGYYVPVDTYKQTEWSNYSKVDVDATHESYEDGDLRGDLRTKIFLEDSLQSHTWRAVEGFNYEKYGFVYTSIGYVPEGSNLSHQYKIELPCASCTWYTALWSGCTHKKSS